MKALCSDSSRSSVLVSATTNRETKKTPQKAVMIPMNLPKLVFWGVFFVSLFVVALTNTLDLEESEQRAFILLRRLFTRKILRENACKMIQSRYLIRTEERKPEVDRNRLKIRQNQL
jgi:hypothetical protein